MIALSIVRIPADETLGAKTSARNLAAQTIRTVAMEATGGKPASVVERTRAGTRKPPNRHKAAPPQCDLEILEERQPAAEIQIARVRCLREIHGLS
jgi:hypothetical protein